MKPYRGPPMALRSAARTGVRLIVSSFARLQEQVAKTRRSARLISWRIIAKTWWRRVWPRIKNWSWTATWTAISTCVMALFTVGIYLVGRAQWQTFQQQLTAMQGQLNAMEADQRPWVKIQKLEPYQSPIGPALGGLMFRGSHDVGFLPLHFLLKNVGRSPAFEIRVAVGQFFGYAEQKTDLAKEEQKRCAALDTAYPPRPMIVESTNLIPVLFPGDEAPDDNIPLAILRTQLDQLEDQGKNGFQLWFYGCIRYRFTDLKEPHQTSFAYQVVHIVDAPVPPGKAMDLFFKFGEDIPADQIRLRPQPMTSGITN
jgi:hypothetical protein